MRHGLLHYPGALDHLGQEHLAVTEQIADHVHASHQRTFDHFNGMAGVLTAGFRVVDNVTGNAFNQGMLQALLNGPLTPGKVFFFGLAAFAFELFGGFKQAIGGVIPAVQNHVFHQFLQIRLDLVVNHQLAGIHDAHIHAGLDRVIEEDRVNGLTYRIVAAERERHVADATGDRGVGAMLPDPACGVDEVHRVVVVLFDAGGNGKDVGVKDNVGRVEADAGQHIIGALADFGFAFEGIGLAVFVKGHHHHRSAVAHAVPGTFDELLFAFFQADGVHHGLALNTAQTCFDHIPLGRVDHDGYAGNVRFRGHQVQERNHHLPGIQHALVHVDIDDLRTVLNLIPGNAQGFLILFFLDQPQEALGAGYVGAFTHVDEQGVFVTGKRFQAGESECFRAFRNLSGRILGHCLGDGFNMIRARAATAADDVQKAVFGKAFNDLGHFLRGLVVFAKLVGQPGIGVG